MQLQSVFSLKGFIKHLFHMQKLKFAQRYLFVGK